MAALMAAFDTEETEIVKLLLNNGADMSDKDTYHQTVYTYTASIGDVELMEFLFQKSKENISQKDLNLSLCEASYNGHEDIVKLLLEKGAEVNNSWNLGENALMKAARRNFPKVVKLLCNSGADLEKSDSKGNTALQYAAYEGSLDVVKLLLEYGANIETRNNLNWSSLMQAVLMGHLDVVELLLENKCEVNVIGLERGETEAILAADLNRLEIMKLLIKFGANIGKTDKDGNNVLNYAKKRENQQMIKSKHSIITEKNHRI
jgi:ankyrin repeat protein